MDIQRARGFMPIGGTLDGARGGQWQLLALLCLVSISPLLLVDLPPLTDLYGHVGRFAIQTELAERPQLQPFYSFRWTLIGNLGTDLLVELLHPLLGLEGAVRAAVIATQLLASFGILAIAREVHGRITPFAVAALPLIYAMPFNYGFINYALAMALALNVFALWLHLLRTGREQLARGLLLAGGAAIWVSHTYGWAFLCLMCGSTLLAEALAGRAPLVPAIRRTIAACWPLLLPLALMVIWRAGSGPSLTGDWSIALKGTWLISVLRNRWMAVDILGAFALFGLVFWAIRSPAARFEPRLAAAALLSLACFVALPMNVIGSTFADMRILPYTLVLALLAVSPRAIPIRTCRTLAVLAAAFLAVRTLVTGWAYVEADREIAAHLPALEAVPTGSRVAFFVVSPCGIDWAVPVLDHIGSMAIVRRNAFVNDQWQGRGHNPLAVHHPAAGAFIAIPSQTVKPEGCDTLVGPTLAESLAALPRAGFSHVWIVGDDGAATPVPADLAALPIRGKGRLYAIRPAP